MTVLEPLLRELVGEALRRRRLAQGRTLADVAERAGMSMQHLSDVERGRKDPSSEILAAICGALGIDLGRLLVLTAQVKAPSPAGSAGLGSGAPVLSLSTADRHPAAPSVGPTLMLSAA